VYIQCPSCYALIYSEKPSVEIGVFRCSSCKGFALTMVSSVRPVCMVHNKKVPKHSIEQELYCQTCGKDTLHAIS